MIFLDEVGMYYLTSIRDAQQLYYVAAMEFIGSVRCPLLGLEPNASHSKR